MKRTQDPKYGIVDSRLVNVSTGEPIPESEPIFILRAKDVNAAEAIAHYVSCCEDEAHVRAGQRRIVEFVRFAEHFSTCMKEPDTAHICKELSDLGVVETQPGNTSSASLCYAYPQKGVSFWVIGSMVWQRKAGITQGIHSTMEGNREAVEKFLAEYVEGLNNEASD